MTHRLVQAGDAAFIVEFVSSQDGRVGPEEGPEEIDTATNARVVALARALGEVALPGVLDVVPAFSTLAVHFDPLRTDAARLAALVDELAVTAPPTAEASLRCVDVPVCYEGEYGPDLSSVATATGLDPAQVVALHCAPMYRVFMVGFSPGFPYLGIVDPRLRVPRRPTPRVRVAAGAVGLAGPQTGIYSIESPGGWNIIGRTPLRLFEASRPAPCLLGPGTQVRFLPITALEYGAVAACQGSAG